MEITTSANIHGTVVLDPEDYYTYEEGDHVIQVQSVGYHVDHADRLGFTSGRGHRVLKDGSLGSQRRNVYTGRGVPDRVQEKVLAAVQEYVAEVGRKDITLYKRPVRKVAR